MAERNIFIYKHFLSLKFQILVYFLQKKLPSPLPILKKSDPLFPSNPALRIEILSIASISENLLGGSNPPAERWECILWDLS